MKLIHSNSPLIHSDDMTSSTMGMDSKGMEMATFYLRDKIYSDKIAAVVREYICNALDEHKKYNIQTPVKITLKDGVYSVRDFANGLNEHDVRNVFGMYFRSTKNDSNLQSGMFGVGSKAGFCYTDTFYVKSYHEGVVTTYACSLGAGQSGVSVGQILKISEEPSIESGLEISLDVKTSDVYDFVYKTKQFLATCTQDAEFFKYENSNDVEHYVNAQPVKTVKINDYSFKLVPVSKSFNIYNMVCYVMGNVCYKSYNVQHDFNQKFKNDIIKDHYIIIDVPIGKMSLPISREGFENTTNNQRILTDIQQSFEQLKSDDAQKIKTLSIKELIDSRDEFYQNAEWFCFKKSNLYPEEIYKVVSTMKSYTNQQTIPFETKDGKYIVALIPNKESADYWVDKFRGHLSSINKNYYYVNERYLDETNIKHFEDLFLFKKVKSSIFSWPKKELAEEKDGLDVRYVVSHLYGGRWSPYKEQLNALELHNMVFKNNATDEQSAKNDFVNYKFETLIDLNNVSIKKSFGPGDHIFSTTSKKMVENMKLLGWYEVGSTEYLAKREEIQQAINKKQEQLSKLTECKLNFLNNNSSFLDKLKKKQKYINKYRQILFNIKKEKSLRNNLLNALEYNSWNSPKISRKQLRTILKIKD